MEISLSELRPAGYAWLLEKLGLTGIPNWHRSMVSRTGAQYTKFHGDHAEQVFRVQYWPGDKVGDHLEFALKYDGVNLGLLALIFSHIAASELADHIKSRPIGKYARRLWFFFEFLTGSQLPICDLTSGNYVDAMEPEKYFTLQNGEKSRRHRVVDNLPGCRSFCPVVRKSKKLSLLDYGNLRQRCEEIVRVFPPELLRRALSYLYNKETRSSFAIEHIEPGASRTEKFIALLELAGQDDFCSKQQLIELQNRIVDPRFRDHDYRSSQNYVGQTVAGYREVIHFIGPRPDDLPDLMAGLIEAHQRLKSDRFSAIIHAAVIAWGFVFLHPFEDGNGRIHRFLVHNILALRGVLPTGLMFPVSAVMLKDPAAYDASLEAFSRPLLQQIDYQLHEDGKMTVTNNTACWYRYFDATAQAEALFDFVERTVEEELVAELSFLANFDNAKKSLQRVVDMPDRLIDLFIQLCLQNNGRLAKGKRSAHFAFLSEEELKTMETAVKNSYSL
ncbi:MAG: Fic family protein [Candidatus Riflebacteria bacterium]|nr:Fic family protein [Candidatus Riflebacteria bacterium]